ncbi:amidase [Acidisphaera sp. L21]|uniref:amidase n=1 Tax=Acidisphaera sp. L21 TaxID=1641851 RepID=UPI00131BDC4C|nr:amidase [Acidisphaera sp. L21]
MTEAWALTATGLSAAFATGALTPEAALESVLHRIEAGNPALNAVVTIDLQGARRAAAAAGTRWRCGQSLGPLDGVPLTIKDNLHVGGLRATWGSRLFADFIAPQDDLPVARLRAAGAVIVGKTNTPELSLSGYTDNLVFGSTGNPWAPALSPGGSSGGPVAAVSSGMGPLALATDAGGSIRRPSGHAGVAGLKPGVGRVPQRFGFPALAHDLQVIGPIARCVADLRTAFLLMAPALPPVAPSLGRLRIGSFAAIGNAPIEPAVTAAFAAACDVLRAQGHSVTAIAPLWDPDEVGALFSILASVGVARVMTTMPGWETNVTAAIAKQAHAGFAVSATDYVLALDRLSAFRAGLLDAMRGWDVIATPSSPALPWPRANPYPTPIDGRTAPPGAAAIFSTAINLAGLPAIVVPAPLPPGALPVGLQLIAAPDREILLLDLAEHFEAASPWRQIAIAAEPTLLNCEETAH